jgi:phage shock protein PspC (stress-responsive transcriptional regulator)
MKPYLLIVGVIVLVFFGLCVISYSTQKADCLAEGGKWISGVVGGNATYFCIPK